MPNTHFTTTDLKKISEIVAAFNNERDHMKLLDVIITKMRDIANCEAGTLYETQGDILRFAIMHNEKQGVFLRGAEIKLPPIDLKKPEINNVSAYCAINNTVVNIHDVYSNTDFDFSGAKDYDAMTGYRTKSMMAFPLSDIYGNVIGVIQLINARDETGGIIPFDGSLEFIFRSLSNIAATSLANLRYIAEIKELFYSIVEVMSEAMEERTPYNVNHTKQTADYIKNFTRYLRGRFPYGHRYHFDENREEQLVMAALLHDIGKVVTPLEVMNKQSRLGDREQILRQRFTIKKLQEQTRFLSGQISEEAYAAEKNRLDELLDITQLINAAGFLTDENAIRIKELSALTYTDENGDIKPLFEDYDIECLSVRKGTLTDMERKIIQEHVSITKRLLDNIRFNKQYEFVPVWAASHHELLDGTGYPNGTSGNYLPPEARIITITDIYDSLTARDRPYKKAIPREKSLSILREMVNEGKLDRELVELFIESGVWRG